MAKGKSGRIVLEIDPSQKEELYKFLGMDGLTLKEWFLERVSIYLDESKQPSLFKNNDRHDFKS